MGKHSLPEDEEQCMAATSKYGVIWTCRTKGEHRVHIGTSTGWRGIHSWPNFIQGSPDEGK